MADIEEFDFLGEHGTKITCFASEVSQGARDTLPYAQLREYQQDRGSIVKSITRWGSIFSKKGFLRDNPYTGLYSGTKTAEYRLPYFTNYHHQIQNSWGENNGVMDIGKLRGLLKVGDNAGKVMFPAGGIITYRSFEGASPSMFEIKFDLINTVGKSNTEIKSNISNNQKFLDYFIYQNLLEARSGGFGINPPCLYEVYIPNVRWSPVATVSQLTIENKGTLNRGKAGYGSGTNWIVPDAWGVTIQFTELLSESRTFYQDIKDGLGDDISNVTVNVING